MITEVRQALGSWELQLRPSVPGEILDALDLFGHLAVLPGKVDVATAGDGLLDSAQFVGVYRGRSATSAGCQLKGVGMAFWLGDEDGKGDVFVNAVTAASATFADTVRALLPPGGAVTEGALHSVPGTYSATHQWQTPREALTYVTDTFSTETYPVSWRVNGNGTLDAGRDVDMFQTTPRAILVRKGSVGRELDLVGLAGVQELERDGEDYSTGVILLAEGEGNATATGSAFAPSVPYSDLHGNDVVLTRLVSESETSATNADTRAQLQLNRFSSPRYAVTISSDDYDVRGELAVGDTLAVFDPENGFTDADNETFWQGVPINPIHLRCSELSWPVPAGWTVAFRRADGTWLDLSDHYVPETGATRVVVGDFDRSLSGIGSEAVGTRPVQDSSTPATPVFGTAYTGNYSTEEGTRAQILLTWSEPLNTDGSTVLDGSHYEIRYRPNVSVPYPATWDEASTETWDDLYTWDQPRVPPITETDWHVLYAPWETEQLRVLELLPQVGYEFQIRAVDQASPPNRSIWSSSLAVEAARDRIAPSQPAAPSVAASLLAVQVTHTLGRADGGVFNLEADLHHLEVHVSQESTFLPDSTTQVGAMPAASALASQVPLVATFSAPSTTARYVKVVAVDRDGNRSNASPAASSSVDLIDDQYITNLSVSKLTAGTMTAAMILGGEIATGVSGSRVVMDSEGLYLFDQDGSKTVDIDATTGDAVLSGRFKTAPSGMRIEIVDDSEFYPYPTMFFSVAGVDDPDDVKTMAFINAVGYEDPAGDVTAGIGVNSGAFTVDTAAYGNRLFMTSDIRLECVDDDQQFHHGLVMGSDGYLSLSNSAGGHTVSIDGNLHVRGSFNNNADVAPYSNDAIMCGNVLVGSGYVAVAYGYGATMANLPMPAVTIYDNIPHTYSCEAATATGFTVSLGEAASGSWRVLWVSVGY